MDQTKIEAGDIRYYAKNPYDDGSSKDRICLILADPNNDLAIARLLHKDGEFRMADQISTSSIGRKLSQQEVGAFLEAAKEVAIREVIEKFNSEIAIHFKETD